MRFVALALVLVPIALNAQSTPTFEVATVKPNISGDADGGIRVQPGGRYAWTNMTLKQLIGTAHGVDRNEIVGGPGWLDADRFDIVAQVEAGVPVLDANGSPGPLFMMLRALLEDRFQLKVHTESRERPIYALTVLRRDGNVGPGVRASSVDCAAIQREQAAGTFRRDPDRPVPCAIRAVRGHVDASAIGMPMLANVLSSVVGTRVVDRTGLAGLFDVTLEFRPEFQAAFNVEPDRGEPAASPDAPAIFTAVQEQLGLRLQSTRGPVDVLVIDRAERPGAN